MVKERLYLVPFGEWLNLEIFLRDFIFLRWESLFCPEESKYVFLWSSSIPEDLHTGLQSQGIKMEKT